MEWLAMISLICVTAAPKANVSVKGCEAYYKACIERAVQVPDTKATEIMIATVFYDDPSTRFICDKFVK